MPPKDSLPPKNARKSDGDRRLRQASRLARVLRVLPFLQAQSHWTLRQIAHEVECSPRTLCRDLAVLEMAGISGIQNKTNGCLRVMPGFQIPILGRNDWETTGKTSPSPNDAGTPSGKPRGRGKRASGKGNLATETMPTVKRPSGGYWLIWRRKP